jgi:hypothetical protein
VVAFPSFEALGEVHHRLDGFPLEVKFVNATLRYHLTWQDLVQSDGKSRKGTRRTRFNGPLQDGGKLVGQIHVTLLCDFTHLRVD